MTPVHDQEQLPDEEQLPAKTVKLFVDPNWNQRATVIVDEGLESESSGELYFSKNQASTVIGNSGETGLFSREQIEQLQREIAESPLPESLGNIRFVECILCKGHGWLVTDKFASMGVRSKRKARLTLLQAPADLGLTPEDRERVLSEISASTLPEETRTQVMDLNELLAWLTAGSSSSRRSS